MKSFLEYVAADIIGKLGKNLSRVAIIFPNKRASLFMNDYLYASSQATMWGPTYLTISELFRSKSCLKIADEIQLISLLYNTFKNISSSNESLDHFYPWGKILLSDFDDIDKNMADAKQVFTNVKNLNEMNSDEYLSEDQRKALAALFGDFSGSSQIRKQFTELWNILFDVYTNFKKKLTEQGLAYEGMLYRNAIENKTDFEEYEKYIFIGFNFLDKVEQKLFSQLKKSGKAMFYWDYDEAYMHHQMALPSDPGTAIGEHLLLFPNELGQNGEIYDNLNKEKNISLISSSTDNIQARYVSQWLTDDDCRRIKAGRRSAIVLADEKMLLSINHSLPNNVDDASIPLYNVNITTGFPLSETPMATLVDILLQLRIERRNNSEFKKSTIEKLMRHPLARHISETISVLPSKLEKTFSPYINNTLLALDEKLSIVFSGEGDDNSIVDISVWMGSIINLIADNSSETADSLFRESIYKLHLLFNRITDLAKEGYLNIETSTYQRLIRQIILSTTIPFHGEPAQGLQIMGVLETRNLDFDNILILSCNEGKWPNGLNVNSFIPYNIRKAFSLTTIDNKIGIQSFHFFRLMQRATDITIVYNNATDDGRKGEMSRFVLQLMTKNKNKIHKKSLQAKQNTINRGPTKIEKDSTIIDILNKTDHLSPTSINNYLNCNLRFYFREIAGIKEPDDDTQKIGGRTFGNIYHRAAQLIYLSMTSNENLYDDGSGHTIIKNPYIVSKEQIEHFLNSTGAIERYVDIAFNEELFHEKDNTVTPTLNGLQIINRKVIIQYMRTMLEKDRESAPFKIIGLEVEIKHRVTITPSQTICTKGIIDRLDIVTIGGKEKIRVVDYKTGRMHLEKISTLDEVFISGEKRKQLSDYYFQTMLYATIVRSSSQYNPNDLPTLPALLFIQGLNTEGYSPVLKINNKEINDIDVYTTQFYNMAEALLREIYSVEKPFLPTGSNSKCEHCPYKQICHK